MLAHRITTWLLLALVITLMFMPVITSEAADKELATADPDNAVVATVNGSKIMGSTLSLYQRRRGMPHDADPIQQRKAILEELINMELLYQDAIKNGADKTTEFTKAYELEVEHLRKNMLASYMLTQRAKTAALSDDEMKSEYEKRKADLANTEYRARHILLDTEAEAKSVIEQLNKGADFTTLAKEKSTSPDAAQGGDLEWFAPDQMLPAFSQATAALAKGKYTTTPVRTQYGWHVILKEDERKVDAPPFDDVKEQLRMRLQNKLVETYIGELRKGAKIERK